MVCKARLDSNKHPKDSEIDCGAGIERDPEQRDDEVAKLGTHSGVFYAEFAIVENLLKLRELISDWNRIDLREASIRRVFRCLRSSGKIVHKRQISKPTLGSEY